MRIHFKKVNRLIILSLLTIVLYSCNYAQKEPRAITILTAEEFGIALSANQEVQILDVRTPIEYKQGFIPGSLNININESGFLENINALDKSKPVYVYCKAGGRSAKAAKILKEEGFTEIYDLQGGYTSWVSSKK